VRPRRSGKLAHLTPSAFRARIVDVVGIVDVVEPAALRAAPRAALAPDAAVW